MKRFSSTTKASLRHTSQNKRIVRVLLVGLALAVLWYVVPRTLSFTASVVLSPIVSVESWLSESGSTIPAYFRDRRHLLDQLDEKDQALSVLSGSDTTISRLLQENETLRSLLGASSSVRIAAGVIGRPTVVPYDVLVLDQGSVDGVQLDTPVFSGRDQVIGYISEVFTHTAVATLVTTPNLESTVYIIGPNIFTTAVGKGGGVLEVGVPQGITLATGDLVVVPSFDAGIYGEIVSVDSLPTRPEQYGYVTINVPMHSLRWVSIGSVPLRPIDFETARTIVSRINQDFTTVPVPAGVLVELPAEQATTSTSSPAIP